VITAHLGVAAAAHSCWPRTPLLWLLPAAVAPDLLDVAYALTGVCSPYGLYSHTIPAAALVAAVLGGGAFLATSSRVAGLVTAAMVLTHLPLDLVTGSKIYWPGGPVLGLALYGRPLLDFLVEVPLVLGGWWMLRRSGRGPRWATLWLPVVGLVVVQAVFDGLDRDAKPSGCAWSTREQP
jgi:hypothetical protein